MSSIRRSIQVLDLLARKGPLGVRAVAQQLGLPLGSVHRLLLDLADEDVVERTEDGEWELSFRLLGITGLQLDRLELPRSARPFAERIAEATRETVNSMLLSGHGRRLHRQGARQRAACSSTCAIGSRGAAHGGGAGKAMLAYPAEAEQVTQVSCDAARCADAEHDHRSRCCCGPSSCASARAAIRSTTRRW